MSDFRNSAKRGRVAITSVCLMVAVATAVVHLTSTPMPVSSFKTHAAIFHRAASPTHQLTSVAIQGHLQQALHKPLQILSGIHGVQLKAAASQVSHLAATKEKRTVRTSLLQGAALLFSISAVGLAAKNFLSPRGPAIAMCSTTGIHDTGYEVTRLSDRYVVYGVPMFDDNYGWLITNLATKQCAAVDPGDASPILRAVEALGLNLTRVLITHKHSDHTGGNNQLKRRCPGLQVIGTGYESIPALDVAVKDGDKVDLFGNKDPDLQVSTIFTPCHTRGHVVFFIETGGPDPTPALFCGDTLFVGGCGRFFEGDASQMYTALVKKMGLLPPETLVFCAHEYTESNLKFALQVEPANQALQSKWKWVLEQRRAGRSTVPSTLLEERSYNPFMRCGEKEVLARIGTDDPIESMRRLREGKNRGSLSPDLYFAA